MNLEDRFWSKVNVLGEDDCWEWQASLFDAGYGNFRYLGKNVGSNRMVWFLSYGEFPDLLVCHSCDNRKCCNPNHLFLGTHKDNAKDMVNKNRNFPPNGESNGNNKLTSKDVIEIRDLFSTEKYTHSDLSLRYNVSRVSVTNILNRTTWKHL